MTSISRITKRDIERLESWQRLTRYSHLALTSSTTWAAVKEIVHKVENMRDTIAKHIKEVQELKAAE